MMISLIVRFLILAMVLPVISSCGIAEGPRQKLQHASFMFNEGLRWGRYNDVLPRVDPASLDHFSEMHQGWGEKTLLSNAEIMQTIYDDKEKKAEITVKFTWYRHNELVVYDTITKQSWAYSKGRWIMMAEEYISGEPF